MSATIDPKYQKNVEALEKAMPKELTASEIEVRLGATWIPVEIYQQFLYELLDTPSWVRNYTKLSYSLIMLIGISVQRIWIKKRKS